VSQNDERRPPRTPTATFADPIVTALGFPNGRPAERPALIITIPLEGRPCVRYQAANDADEFPLDHWIRSCPGHAPLVVDALRLSVKGTGGE
jgi:hypothetical protein